MKNAIDALKQLGIAAQTFGEGSEVVVCVHGWLDNSNSFKPMLSNIDSKFTYIAVDLMGHGQSKWRSADAHYYFLDYVYDLLNIIDQLEVANCYLVGHSLGAMVCGLFAALYPERTNSLVMIEGIGLVCSEPDEIHQQMQTAFEQRKITDKFKKRLYSNFDALTTARSQAGDLKKQDAALLMSRNTQKVEGGFYLTTDPRLKTQSGFRFSKAQALAVLKDINVPSLLITGSKGYQFVKQNLSIFKNNFNNLEVTEISGGHHCHMDNPQQCIALVEQHMNRNTLT
ncbi:alpha/beta fold hydrolase [Pseudoalteromonas sp. S16_S37]|uniref:alpha/beta fold hydrolase n=1 Tax=Pseudoalteromonas sp. S16_S37 TaxID=2720228 RepID=UPI0016808691|nr:alpha/beta hydrolase [Pseudoalteromonas sp. S16_S37]MBD1583924.1 alpha/beta hydrolase [Pseudoalteromonas sp. S16_S37]